MILRHDFDNTYEQLNNQLINSNNQNSSLEKKLREEQQANITLQNELNPLKVIHKQNLDTITEHIEQDKKIKLELAQEKDTINQLNKEIAELKPRLQCSSLDDHKNISALTNQAKELARIKIAGRWLFGTTMFAGVGAAAYTAITNNPNAVFNLFGFSTKHSAPIITAAFLTGGVASGLIGYRSGFFNFKKQQA